MMKNKIDVDIVPTYNLFKIGRYFQMKSNTPLALWSNVVFKFIGRFTFLEKAVFSSFFERFFFFSFLLTHKEIGLLTG